jgi:hypothetical protein
MVFPGVVMAHAGGIDKNGGHFDRKANVYHCHKASCIAQHKAADEAFKEAKPGSYNKLYNRKDWPHWIDEDGDCQNTRHEALIAASLEPVVFKKGKRCTVNTGRWFDEYTGMTFVKASDLDIDHIIPLAHAHRNGAASWTRKLKRKFANDPLNLIVVDDATNQSKSDKAPHEWMPPRKGFACAYLKRWKEVKNKYGLSESTVESRFISKSLEKCP